MSKQNADQFYNNLIKKIHDLDNFKLNKSINKEFAKKFINDFLMPIYKEKGSNLKEEDIISYQTKLSPKQLVKICGGKMDYKTAVSNILSLITLLGITKSDVNAKPPGNNHYMETIYSGKNLLENKKEISDMVKMLKSKYTCNTKLINHLSSCSISEAQNKAFKITNSLIKTEKHFLAACDKISSSRYSKKSVKTDLEAQLDKDVENGDLPVKEFFLKDINKEYSKYLNKSDNHVEFIIPPLNKYGKGIDAYCLHEYADNESIVQVASQFNCLESVSEDLSPVKNWVYDQTQGPRACLQSVAASKHREAASLQGKLPDSLKVFLEKCLVKDDFGQYIPITFKYPELYKNGYLRLNNICKEKRYKNKNFIKRSMSLFLSKKTSDPIEDLMILKNHIRNNTGEIKFLSQWIKCEGSGKTQLQVFCSAPSFQNVCINWNSNDIKTSLFKDICTDLVVMQYKAIAQAAAIRAEEQRGTPVSLHLTLVGQGAFNNPPEIIAKSIKTVRQQLLRKNVKVYLHGWNQEDCNKWQQAINYAEADESL